ncbi:MAG: cytochrome C [Desulfuromonadales bacterium]|nr:cytochrome C [Desulfuromonadales bacterium]
MRISKRITFKRLVSGVVVALALTGVSFAATQGKKIATVTITPAPEQYAGTPQPLTAAQCAQCHVNPYQNLKDSGGRHQFACQNCHKQFHEYNPRKANYDAIMPKCASCHEVPHGPKITDCSACHANPHTPRKIAATAQLVNACFDCHGSVREQLVKFPSKHSKVACSTCHTSHGFKPSCFTCHKSHTEGLTLASCTQCHQVHRPLQIPLAKDVPSSTCGSCHAKVFSKLTNNTSKHRALACVTCHKDKHRYIPQCTDCHGKPHKQAFLDKFPNCLTCHIDVHDLPNMKTQPNK